MNNFKKNKFYSEIKKIKSVFVRKKTNWKYENTKSCEAKNMRHNTPRGTKEATSVKSMAFRLSSRSFAFLCQSSWAAGAPNSGELHAEPVLSWHPHGLPGCEELWLEFQLPLLWPSKPSKPVWTPQLGDHHCWWCPPGSKAFAWRGTQR